MAAAADRRDNDDELAERACSLLKAAQRKGLTVIVAESCTAGALAALLARAPGAANQFQGGFVTYTKEQKVVGLGVSAALIHNGSAVCGEVAEAMGRGALERSAAHVAVSVTGVTGPEPDEDGNPMGLVFIGGARRNGGAVSERHMFRSDDPGEVERLALAAALEMLETLIGGTDA